MISNNLKISNLLNVKTYSNVVFYETFMINQKTLYKNPSIIVKIYKLSLIDSFNFNIHFKTLFFSYKPTFLSVKFHQIDNSLK